MIGSWEWLPSGRERLVIGGEAVEGATPGGKRSPREVGGVGTKSGIGPALRE